MRYFDVLLLVPASKFPIRTRVLDIAPTLTLLSCQLTLSRPRLALMMTVFRAQ
jgi:hypothetical protein